jgi:hypothetical protein
LANDFGLHPAVLHLTFAVDGENLISPLTIDLDLQMPAKLARAIAIKQRCNNVNPFTRQHHFVVSVPGTVGKDIGTRVIVLAILQLRKSQILSM